jgi:hypothetical protein
MTARGSARVSQITPVLVAGDPASPPALARGAYTPWRGMYAITASGPCSESNCRPYNKIRSSTTTTGQVRPPSLGGRFIELPIEAKDAEDARSYARAVGASPRRWFVRRGFPVPRRGRKALYNQWRTHGIPQSGTVAKKAQRGRWPQAKRSSPRPPCFSSLNTEGTEHPSDLWVEALRANGVTKLLLTGGEIFARSEETRPE